MKKLILLIVAIVSISLVSQGQVIRRINNAVSTITETDPVYALDSASLLKWLDTVAFIATKNDLSDLGGGIPIGVSNYILDSDNGVVVGGLSDSVKANYSFIGGGARNMVNATAEYSFIGGGGGNKTDTTGAVIVGGGYDNNSGNWVGNYNKGINGFIGAGTGDSILPESINSVITGGYNNKIYTAPESGTTGSYAFIGGGGSNIIAGEGSVISGGAANTVLNMYSVISGGLQNVANGNSSVVSGGQQNKSDTTGSVIAGGGYDTGTDSWVGNYNKGVNGFIGAGALDSITGGALNSAIVGGAYNKVGADYSFLGGGKNNRVDSEAQYGLVLNGEGNIVTYDSYSTVIYGYENSTSEYSCTVVGGEGNVASDSYATIAGGYGNVADAGYAFIGNGEDNRINGQYSTILNGIGGISNGLYGTILSGYRGKGNNQGQVVTNAQSFSYADTGSAQSSTMQVSDTVHHNQNVWHDLYANGEVGNQYISIDSASVWTFEVKVIGTTANSAKAWSYTITGAIKRDNGNNTTLLGSTVSVVFESDADFDCQVIADDTNESLSVQVKDATSGGDVVRWVATIQTTEVRFKVDGQ